MPNRPSSRLRTVLPFIAIVCLFLFIANLVVYEALASIFSIDSLLGLIWLGALLGILGASFIAATILGMWHYNWFTRMYSIITSVWMGFFAYLFLISVLYGVLLRFPIGHIQLIGRSLVALIVLVGMYGIFHARKIKIKEVEVPLRAVPEKWKGRKAVWVSDLHLGQVRAAAFARRVTEKINSISPDVVFIGGDLFDGTSAPDLAEMIAPLRALNAPLGVYFITGNHEEFGASAPFLSAVRSAGISVLQDAMVVIDDMQFIGADHHTASDKSRFQRMLSGLGIDTSKPSILLKHEPKDLDVAEAAGVSFQISGHTHRAQMWPLGYIARLVYKGYEYGLKRYGDMHVYTSSGVGTWGPPMRVGTDAEIVILSFAAPLK